MIGSVCSRSHPVSAWPASWNATTFLSASDITLLFFSIPEIGHMTVTWQSLLYNHWAYLQWLSQWHTQSHARWPRHLCTWRRVRLPHSQCWQCQHLHVYGESSNIRHIVDTLISKETWHMYNIIPLPLCPGEGSQSRWVSIHRLLQQDLLQIDLKDGLPFGQGREIDQDLSVEPSRSEQGLVEDVNAIGGR